MTGSACHAGPQLPSPGGPLAPGPGADYVDDDGSPDVALREVLAARVAGRCQDRDLVAHLAGARLLVPVVPVQGETGQRLPGHSGDRDSYMAAVSLVGRDGRRALLAFTGVDSLAAWDAGARPIPTAAAMAAQAVQQEQADALLIDVAGPHPWALTGPALTAVAGGGWPAPQDDPVVRSAVAAAALSVPGVRRVRVEPASAGDADVHLVLDVAQGVDATSAAGEVAARLSRDPVLRAALERGISIAVL